MANRLGKEKSPYLLQHKNNPVDWYPWSEEAFEKARAEEKPVFLSVGYSTCHWCHVMARESFEDETVASLMNEAFVNIKVDREERPDIDHTYMTVCQMLTGEGGWPLTIIMTPEKKPFYAATYLPKERRFNRPGMMEIVPRIRHLWQAEREQILASAENISRGFSRVLEMPGGGEPDESLIHQARKRLEERFDPVHGGFEKAPKFPSPHLLLFLMQYSSTFRDEKALDMCRQTLEKMRLGGIYDQIGFGFHRYATDPAWRVPHFEKMLYDQALLMLVYAEGWRLTGDPFFRQTVHEIASYLSERLTSGDGGFYSAEDAESEGIEGKYYLWELKEIGEILDPADAALVAELFNLEPDGNYLDEATRSRTGLNLLWMEKRPEEFAAERGVSSGTFTVKLEKIRRLLEERRSERPRPRLDDKILTDWNGLMIAALARSGSILENDTLTDSAVAAWNFLSDRLIDEKSGTLLHRYRDGEAAIPGLATDYASLIWGAIELSQATLDPLWLERAIRLNRMFLDRFWDPEGGFFLTGEGVEAPLGRQKEIYDGAIPSSNSIAAMNLIRLSRLTGEPDLEEKAGLLFRTFSAVLSSAPDGVTHCLQALIHAVKPSAEVVICGHPEDPEVLRMIRTVRTELKEPYVMLLKSVENRERLSRMAPYTEAFPLNDAPSAWFCRNFRCEMPVHTAAGLRELFNA